MEKSLRKKQHTHKGLLGHMFCFMTRGEIVLPRCQADRGSKESPNLAPLCTPDTWSSPGAGACLDIPETHDNYRAPFTYPGDFLCELVCPIKKEIQDNKLSSRAQMSLMVVFSSPPGLVISNEFQLTSWMNYRWRSVYTQ